jgi:hypothetical protein
LLGASFCSASQNLLVGRSRHYPVAWFWQLILNLCGDSRPELELMQGTLQAPRLALIVFEVGWEVHLKPNIGPQGMTTPSAQASLFQLLEVLS